MPVIWNWKKFVRIASSFVFYREVSIGHGQEPLSKSWALYFGKLIGDEIVEIELNHWLAEFNETKKLAKINPTHPEVKS